MCTYVVEVRIVFFFKQKTAYEMRISDWSSDVCSSDLRFEWQFALAAVLATGHDVLIALGLFSILQLDFNLTAVAALLALAGYSELGRASCRERVCQYV